MTTKKSPPLRRQTLRERSDARTPLFPDGSRAIETGVPVGRGG
ncbi:hypothetical protein [Chamaesiphon polymorphus]|nr:hypothetical protein [Chamaesiphon polymorphus]